MLWNSEISFLQRLWSPAGFGCMTEAGVFYKRDTADFPRIEHFTAACWELK